MNATDGQIRAVARVLAGQRYGDPDAWDGLPDEEGEDGRTPREALLDDAREVLTAIEPVAYAVVVDVDDRALALPTLVTDPRLARVLALEAKQRSGASALPAALIPIGEA